MNSSNNITLATFKSGVEQGSSQVPAKAVRKAVTQRLYVISTAQLIPPGFTVALLNAHVQHSLSLFQQLFPKAGSKFPLLQWLVESVNLAVENVSNMAFFPHLFLPSFNQTPSLYSFLLLS